MSVAPLLHRRDVPVQRRLFDGHHGRRQPAHRHRKGAEGGRGSSGYRWPGHLVRPGERLSVLCRDELSQRN